MACRGADGRRSTDMVAARYPQAGGTTTRHVWRVIQGQSQWPGSSRTCWQKVHLGAGPALWCAPRTMCDLLQCLILTFSDLEPPQVDADSTTWTCTELPRPAGCFASILMLHKHAMQHRAAQCRRAWLGTAGHDFLYYLRLCCTSRRRS